MGEESAIQWTQATWNPWHGCKKVSAGCKYCYMYRDKEMHKQDPTIIVRSKTAFNAPLKWKEGRVIFTCSWSDWFIEEADGWRDEAWAIIKATPQHTYQILTKRPERIKEHLPADWGDGYSNVWIGVSIENHDTKAARLSDLFDALYTERRVVKLFVSAEPLLGPVDFLHDDVVSSAIFEKAIDWVIVGGESGNDNGKYLYRLCNLEWVEDIVIQCKSANIPVFVKQMGTYLSKQLKMSDRHGGNIDDFPKHLQVREFPVKTPV